MCFRKFCIWLWKSCCCLCLWLRRCCLCCCTFLWKCCCCLWKRRGKDKEYLKSLKWIDDKLKTVENRGKNDNGYYCMESPEFEEIQKLLQKLRDKHEECLESLKLIDDKLKTVENCGKNDNGDYCMESPEFEEIQKMLQDHLKDKENIDRENDKVNGEQSTFHASCVLDSQNTTLDFAAEKLKERLSHFGIELVVTNGNDPVILICNCSTRLQTDINRAMELVKTIPQSRVILVALHLKREEHLPETDLRARLTNKTDFKDIGEMVDIGFDQNDIYDCVKNNSSIQKITKFIRDFKRLDMGENKKYDKKEEDYKNTSGSKERLTKYGSTDIVYIDQWTDNGYSP